MLSLLLLLPLLHGHGAAQAAVGTAQLPAAASSSANLPKSVDRRRAAKAYMMAGKLFLAEHFEEAMKLYTAAATLDPTHPDYALAVGVARSHAVTALVQQAAQARIKGQTAEVRLLLTRAHAIDPQNPVVTQHLNEFADTVLHTPPDPLLPAIAPGAVDRLQPAVARRSFHLNTDSRQTIQQVFRGFGFEVTMDDSVRYERVRFDIDDATFEEATRALALLTRTFYVPLDPRRVLVARDSRELRQQYTRLETETLQLAGASANDLNELANVAKNVIGIQTATPDSTASTLTVRGTPQQLDALNRTLGPLAAGRSQILLDVSLIQLARTNQRYTGAQVPQSFSAFNVAAEYQSILNANSTLVQQIISSGLASADNPLAIIGVLIASGQVSSSLFSNGFATFGGGSMTTAISPGSDTFHLTINSSKSRQLDRVQLRVADGDDQGATLKLGSRYPIQTSTYSSMTSSSSIAGLTTAGTSSALASLLSAYTSSTASMTPQVEYQDLGFTLKAKAAVMRNGRVALNLGLKIDALSGSSLNGNPILNHRNYEGDVQVEDGAAVVVASELDSSQSRAVSGTPGIGDIPGLNQVDSHNKQGDDSTLVVVVTPHIVRSPLSSGHSLPIRIDRNSAQNAN